MSNEIISVTGIAAGLGAKLAYDVCGPTAKYLGGELASYSEAGVDNLKAVFSAAAARLEELGKPSGEIPPRVLKSVINEGYFCENELEASYLGGILASAKSEISRDDRALTYCNLLSSLSSYQIRVHYLLYSSLLNIPAKEFEEVLIWISRKSGATILLSALEFATAMEFSEDENPDQIFEHAFVGLEQKGLAKGSFQIVDRTRSVHKTPEIPFRFFYPSIYGIELFLWGIGVGRRGFAAFEPSLLQSWMPPTITPLQFDFGIVGYS